MSDTQSIQDQYFAWLEKQVSSELLSEIYLLYLEIEDYCLTRYVIRQKLFELTSLEKIRKVVRIVDSDRVFRFKYRKSLSKMSSAMHFYYRFMHEHPELLDQDVSKKTVTEPAPVEKKAETPAVQSVPSVATAAVSEKAAESAVDPAIRQLDFQDIPLLAFTQPTEFSYFGETQTRINSWTDLYVRVVQCLLEDYPSVLSVYINHNITGRGRHDFSDAAGIGSLTAPKKVADDFYVETNFSATAIAEKIRQLLERCNVDYENLEVHYRKRGTESSRESSATKAEGAAKAAAPKAVSSTVSNVKPQAKLPVSITAPKAEISASAVEPQDTVTSKSADDFPSQKSELAEFLTEDLYAPLLQALTKQGIVTVQGLKEIKLWPFMNRYNLYSIATRQHVLETIQKKLAVAEPEDSGPQCTLKVGRKEYKAPTPSEAYLLFCEDIARQYPLKFRSLIGRSTGPNGPIAIKRLGDGGHSLRMTNPTAYIDAGMSGEAVFSRISWICFMCVGYEPEITIDEPEELKKSETEPAPAEPVPAAAPVETAAPEPPIAEQATPKESSRPAAPTEPAVSVHDQNMVEQTEQIVLAADIDGISFNDARDALDTTVVAVKRYAKLSKHIVEIKGKLYHDEAFIDWEEGAEKLAAILEKLIQKNRGYVSSAQLYDFARIDMALFLNDNDMDDERAVYDIAQHLFEKVHYQGKSYVFTWKMHISSERADIESNFDVYCRYAEDHGGVFTYTGLVEYLNGVGIKTGNLRTQMKIYTDPVFFYYDTNVMIYAESMHMDEGWKDTARKALTRLFADVGDHIILREIQPVWYDQLPELPGGISWTPLLLQSILKFFGEELGARTIMAMDTQWVETLHAMLVQTDSPIQNFGDVVVSYLLENAIEQRSFEAEELRGILVESEMIQGNELIYNMPKALGGDERFSWDAGGNHVTVLV